ncbi:MAG: helix-turn-helix transcriptional regulator [Pseudonocardiales bacterium]|nr:helix-turn-helix transcriptional regulator [Pseudonocardiales bacterium]
MRGFVVELDDEARMIGRRVRQIRNSRGKSLRVVAGLAGMSKSKLSLIERGEVALDSRSDIIALAEALRVAPSELTRMEVPAPGNGHHDATIEAVRRALTALDHGRAGGEVLPVEVLRDRVTQVQDLRRRCRFADAATELPGLIRDLHTTLALGRDAAELLPLAVYLHVQVTGVWLVDAGAPVDLQREVNSLARRLAREHGADVTLGVAALPTGVLISQGQFDLVQAQLDAVPHLAATPETAGVIGGLMLRHARVAALDNRAADAVAALETAAELAARFGETGEHDPLGFAFGPTDVGIYRMAVALETGEADRTVSIAQELHPQRHPFVTRQAVYWEYYGRALARLKGRQNDAVRALWTAEKLFPVYVQRNPFVRDVLGELLTRPCHDAVGRELRAMAYRAGLPV